MNADIQVVANYKASGFGMEIKAVMASKRKHGYSPEMDGYTPHTAVFWN